MVFRLLFILFFALPLWAKSPVKPPTVVALGDSVTAGYAVTKSQAFPALLEKKLAKKHPGAKVINAGISGATTASAIGNLKWQLRRPFEALILCLGGNDGLRGLKIEQSEENLNKVILMAKDKGIKVLLVGMRIPENYGPEYRTKLEQVYKNLAKRHDIPLMPFLLKDVATKKELNLPDGIHPNEKGYEIIADNLLPYVEKLL